MLAFMLVGVQFVLLGGANALIRFFPELSKKTGQPKSIFFFFLLPVLTGFGLFSAFFLLFQEQVIAFYNNDTLFSEYAVYALPLILFMALFTILDSYIKAALDTVFASFLLEVALRLIVFAGLLLFGLDLISFHTFIIIFVSNYGLQFLILGIYAVKKNLLTFSFPKELISKSLIKRIGSYGAFSFMSGLTIMLVGNIDVIMLGGLTDLAQTGIYAIAFYVGSVIAVPKKAVQKISFPVITNSFEENDLDNIAAIYRKSALNQLIFGLLIYIGVWANLDNLFSMLPQSYAAGASAILIIGAANLFDLATGTNGQIIFASRHYRFDLVATIFLVILAVILNFIFIPKFGITGAAIATASSIFLYNLIKLMYVWHKFAMQPFSMKIPVLVLTGALVLYVITFLPPFDFVYLDIMIRSGIITLLYMLAVLFFNLSEDITNLIKQGWDRIKAFLN